MRPALRPGLLPLWRDRDTVQIGTDPRRAVAISGMSQASDVIRLLDGSRDRDQLVTEASELGIQPAVSERIITLLAAAGVLVDFSSDVLRSLPQELTQQLMPVLAAASVAAQDGDGGARLIARRSSTTMLVCGSGPIAVIIADLLSRSGLAIRSSPVAPVQQLTGQPADPPDLIVLVGHQSPAETAELSQVKLPHLAVYADEAIGVVGPLVLPGVTTCLRCIDLAKAERDPAWPLILAQLAGRSVEPPACDAVLATTVAAQAAAQALAFADQAPLARATANGTLELVCPAWQWRRRSWLPHPACSCGSSDSDRRDPSSGHWLTARTG